MSKTAIAPRFSDAELADIDALKKPEQTRTEYVYEALKSYNAIKKDVNAVCDALDKTLSNALVEARKPKSKPFTCHECGTKYTILRSKREVWLNCPKCHTKWCVTPEEFNAILTPTVKT